MEPIGIDDIKDKKARKSLPGLCEEYRRLRDEEAALSAAKSALMAEIKDHANRASVEKLAGDGWLLTRCHGRKTKISAERLLEKGVPIEVIDASTEVNEYTYFQVTSMTPRVHR